MMAQQQQRLQQRQLQKRQLQQQLQWQQPCTSSAVTALPTATTTATTTTNDSWGCRERFTSPDHFVFNAFIILVLASGLIIAESFQFFFCYLVQLQCLQFYKTPAAALLYAAGLIIGLYLLIPGVLCLLAARRAPGIISAAMWACVIGILLVLMLIVLAVYEVAQYAQLITKFTNNRDKRSINLLICLSCITISGVQLAFLTMEACVCRKAISCQRKGYRVTASDPRHHRHDEYDDDDDDDDDNHDDGGGGRHHQGGALFENYYEDGPTNL